jgi:hypothetical protein
MEMKSPFKLGCLALAMLLCLNSYAQSKYEDYTVAGNIFSDDFSTDRVGWKTGNSADNCYSSRIENGSLIITSSCKGIYPSFWMSPYIDVSRDFEIEAEIQYAGGESNNAVSLVWGKDENYNRYNFAISGDGHFEIFQYNGSFVNLKNWTVPEVYNKTDFNKLTIRKVASNYYFFLNGKLVHTSEFYPFYSNQIGFQDNQNTTMKVNYLKVSYIKPAFQASYSGGSSPYAKVRNPADISSSSSNNGIFIQPFIGFSADYILLTGNFDGKRYYSLDANEFILVPKLSPAPGFGVHFGLRSRRVEVDWAYSISMMKYTSIDEDLSGTSTNHFIRLFGIKGYPGLSNHPDRKVKPYIYFDWSVTLTHVSNLAYMATGFSKTNIRAANFNGMDVGLGAGLEFNLGEKFALDLKVLPEYSFGTDIKSKGDSDVPVKKFNNLQLISSFGINFYFNKK